ncbi:MAG: hypothetical protein M1821_001244 [Bathelium mastoideum]|nr:MAG: hypothetical protein M1821_001244 [Bathelium mastoideum]
MVVGELSDQCVTDRSKSSIPGTQAFNAGLQSEEPSSLDISNNSVSPNASTTDKPHAGNFTAWEFSDPSWDDMQQSVLAKAVADDTDPLIVWSPSNKSTTINPKKVLSRSR